MNKQYRARDFLMIAVAVTGLFGAAASYAENSGDTIYLCHCPPGNPANVHALTISVEKLNEHEGHKDDYVVDSADQCSADQKGEGLEGEDSEGSDEGGEDQGGGDAGGGDAGGGDAGGGDAGGGDAGGGDAGGGDSGGGDSGAEGQGAEGQGAEDLGGDEHGGAGHGGGDAGGPGGPGSFVVQVCVNGSGQREGRQITTSLAGLIYSGTTNDCGP